MIADLQVPWLGYHARRIRYAQSAHLPNIRDARVPLFAYMGEETTTIDHKPVHGSAGKDVLSLHKPKECGRLPLENNPSWLQVFASFTNKAARQKQGVTSTMTCSVIAPAIQMQHHVAFEMECHSYDDRS